MLRKFMIYLREFLFVRWTRQDSTRIQALMSTRHKAPQNRKDCILNTVQRIGYFLNTIRTYHNSQSIVSKERKQSASGCFSLFWFSYTIAIPPFKKHIDHQRQKENEYQSLYPSLILKEYRAYPQRPFQILVGAVRFVLFLEKSKNGSHRIFHRRRGAFRPFQKGRSQKIYSIQSCFLIKRSFIPFVIKGYCFPIIGGQKFYLNVFSYRIPLAKFVDLHLKLLSVFVEQ